MRQAGLILWKDVRYLWRELGMYAVVLTVFAIVTPQTWPDRLPSGVIVMFARAVELLLVVSWLVLIARVVHADRLVGEDQFWLTRPYRWTSMLGAKLLFIAVCVSLPFVVMQWSILLAAGLNPFTAKAGMASVLLKFLLINWLPFMVIGSVTDGLPSAFTSAVGLVVIWGGMLTFVLSGTEGRTAPPFEWIVFGVLISGLLFAILCFQYARRRTRQSRLLIAGALALFLLLVFGFDHAGFGTPVKLLIRQHYPVSGSLRLTPVADVRYDERAEDMRVPRSEIEIKLPMELQGFPAGARLRDTAVSMTLDSGDMHYATAWQPASLTEHSVGFLLPNRIFNATIGKKTSLHLELIGEQLRPSRVLASVVSSHFPGPFDGKCLLSNGKVYCHYAYQEMPVVRMEAETCSGSSSARLRVVPAGTMPDPVVKETLPLTKKVCEGDHIRFTEYASAGRFRVGLDRPDIRIEQYRSR